MLRANPFERTQQPQTYTDTETHAHACHWWFCCGSSACSLVLNQRLRSSYQQQGADWIGLDWIGLDCALQAPKNTSKPKTTQNQTKNETANDFSLSSFSLFLLVAKNCILFLRFLPPSSSSSSPPPLPQVRFFSPVIAFLWTGLAVSLSPSVSLSPPLSVSLSVSLFWVVPVFQYFTLVLVFAVCLLPPPSLFASTGR